MKLFLMRSEIIFWKCDGDIIMIVEDYREDILQMLGG